MANVSLAAITPPVEERWRSSSRLHTFGMGDSIWMEPERIWLVSRGVVLLNLLHPDGEEVVVGLATPGTAFGLPLTSLTAYQAKALSKAELMLFTLVEVESSPNLTQSLVRGLARRLRQAEGLLGITSHRRIEERLRHLLLLLKQEIGQPHPLGTRYSVRLTHQQLATAIGTSRVTITRLLGKLKEEQWLTYDRDRHIILTNAAQI
ncbi:Crp/Fnr family transcriptional regulator [Thermosynechococcus sp. B0]|uniref:Crp/Fnr family transcriptional regulator n=1 Tax=unclassified Thermosynechococcus TaxID=2622553 RepID=UPI00122E4411|nr:MULTISPECIES: Crp/Fnr family transcriptional regulator [unclassified Thermosynechococcus]QEQ00912.1 Crp/Fnr family transcriptional regulator [Thermosynechococcus sp. CL-1]WJI25171.1 Crp/Fnr family transcriptional regulator [Thermosynechococcus sp. B0]WKT84814.1 Crp/Fnr family transcriptional regulator [Thermosynechococcus sp. HY596]WNC63949.1 Crp/Fnr family transcriptional regulator [Thermosynechococcus sp. HY591]WNC66513.1 Crp/Fnr family transcriptional regulator [Thermosynechococcus sp. H